MRRLLVLDTDPGVDDCIALYLAHRLADVDLLAVSTYGNAPLDVTHRNLTGFMACLGERCTVLRGSDAPLSRDASFDGYYGADALCGFSAELPLRGCASADYGEIDACAAAYDEVIYCTLGPMTNLAKALRERMAFTGKITQVVAMGGALNLFDAPHSSEYNFYSDPVAVQEVLTSGIRLTFSPFDLAITYPLDEGEIATACHGASDLVSRLLRAGLDNVRSHGKQRFDVHDAYPVLYCLDPGSFRTVEKRLRVDEWGALHEADDGVPVTVLTDPESRDLLFRTLTSCLGEKRDGRGADSCARRV